jgi:phospholipid/cholesterol/gamma-HCH transport system permease protein
VNLVKPIISLIAGLGDFGLFVLNTFRSSRHFWRRKGVFLQQCEVIGVNSLGVNVAAATFMGAVLGYQLYVSLHRYGSEALIGGTVGVALFRELGPVIAGIMVTGRAGASMAAEISSMRVSEQIDALEIMAVDPIEYLVFPRVAAGLLMMPLLAFVFTMIASFSAYFISTAVMGLQATMFWTQYFNVVTMVDILHLGVKSAVFGLILTWVGCFCGFRAYGGAKAVGQAARNTVVATSLTILSSDYLITSLLPFGFKTLKIM